MKKMKITVLVVTMCFAVSVGVAQDSISQGINIDISDIKNEAEILLKNKAERIKSGLDSINKLPLVNAVDSTNRQKAIEQITSEIEQIKNDIDKFYKKANSIIETGKDNYNKQFEEIKKSLDTLKHENTAVRIVVEKINAASELSRKIGELNQTIKNQEGKLDELTIANNAYKHSLEAIKDSTKFGPFGIGLALGMNIDLFNQTSYYTDRDSLAKSDSYWAIGSGMISAIAYWKFAKRWRVVLNFPLATFLGKDAKTLFNEKVNFGAGVAWDIKKETEQGLSLFLIFNFNTHKRLKMDKYEGYKFPYSHLNTIDIENYDTKNVFAPSLYIGLCYPF
jgi:uncharacterized membrane-anchored protein YhcB (DUF1043 family)